MDILETVSSQKDEYIPHIRNEVLNLMTFLQDIDWTEPWLIGLVIFHGIVTVLTITTRNHGNFQAVFFVLLLLLVFCSSNLNEIAARYSSYFSRQQYFDSNGMFISIVFSSPLLFNCLVMVGQWLWSSGNLMVKVKQAQLRHRLKLEKKQRRQSESHAKKE